MKKNLVPLLGIALIVALVSTGLFYGLFANKLKSAPVDAPHASIVIAARSLDRGTVLKAADVRSAPWPDAAALKGSFGRTADVEGLTVVANMQEGEPVMQSRVTSRERGTGAGNGVPTGMRAVSIHVADSSGVVSLLKPGNKIDVQVVGYRNGRGDDQDIRTLLQNVEVLGVSTQLEPAQGRFPAPVVTVLARPEEVDLLGLADSVARVRIALRNPLDNGQSTQTAPVGIPVMFKTAGVPPRTMLSASGEGKPKEDTIRTKEAPIDSVMLQVRLAGAEPAALDEFRSRVQGEPSGSLHVCAMNPGSNVDEILRRLEAKQQIEVISNENVEAGTLRQASFQARKPGDPHNGNCGLRIVFVPLPSENGMLKLRVQPEITAAVKDGISRQSIVTEIQLSEGQSFLVTGSEPWPGGQALLDRLFPGRAPGNPKKELLVIVTPKRTQPVHSAALRSR